MSQPMSRKQQLLKRHRRNKRISLLIGLLVLIASGVLLAWWLPPVLAVLGWVAHEAWFADHLFYSPKDDYQYSFAPDSERVAVRLEGARLVVDQPLDLTGDETLILAIKIKAGILGRFVDPFVQLLAAGAMDKQTFERGVDGLRYLNLSGFASSLASGTLRLQGRF